MKSDFKSISQSINENFIELFIVLSIISSILRQISVCLQIFTFEIKYIQFEIALKLAQKPQ